MTSSSTLRRVVDPVPVDILGEPAVDNPVTALRSPTEIVFVTGASRSGTSMLARLLGAHSKIHAPHELHYFGELCDVRESQQRLPELALLDLVATLLGRQARGLWEGRPTVAEHETARRIIDNIAAEDRTAAKAFSATLRAMAENEGKSIVCEQTPRNIFYAEQLLQWYPAARVIHIIRDPRGVLASQKNRWKLRQLGARHLPLHEMLRNWVNYHPITMTRLWIKATEAALRLSSHERVLVIRFEDLAADPEAGARQISDFIGVKFERPMLDLPRWGSSNLTHSSDEKGISQQVGEEWRRSLPAAHALVCERMAGSLMTRLGYSAEYDRKLNPIVMLPSLLAYPLHAAAVVLFNPGRAWIQFQAMSGLRK